MQEGNSLRKGRAWPHNLSVTGLQRGRSKWSRELGMI